MGERNLGPSNAELIRGLQEAAREVGGIPTRAEAVETGKLSASVALYCKRFGGWGNACEAAGLGRTRKQARGRQTDQMLIDAMLAEVRRIKRVPGVTTIKRSPTLAGVEAYYARFNCRNMDAFTRVVVGWLRNAGEMALADKIEKDLERRIANHPRRRRD